MLETNVCDEKIDAFTLYKAIPIEYKLMNATSKINDLEKTVGLFNTKVWTLLHGLAIKKSIVLVFIFLTLFNMEMIIF